MQGGTAKTYMNWERIGTPYMRNKVFYLKVKKPGAISQKEVRFYTDAEHFNLCHDIFQDTPLYETFGFKNTEDSIYIIYNKYVSEQEADKYFKSSHGKWYPCVNTKGMFWRAPLDTELPPIKNANHFTKISWADFKKEMTAYARREFDNPKYWID